MISIHTLWQEVQHQILHISFEDNFFESTSELNFSATISNIYVQFMQVNR